MYLNSKFFIQNFSAESSSTVIYAHSGHLNPISTYPALPCRPLGSFLKQEYSKDYFSLILLIGQGSLQVKDLTLGLVNKDLSSPKQGSLEYQLNNLENNVVYYPTTSKLNELLLVRFIGDSACPTEFFPFNVSQRHDGILFLKECTDISIPKSSSYNIFQQENLNDSILDEYSKLLKEKYAERLEKSNAKKNNKIKLIKELKKRIENRTYD